ncbi:DEAD/DEAH box helicase [Corynebacterium sp. TA-R-1]|uniref:DNA 3'-5' helicase n=1 Tax=Corynebacterium stercoris TaxID=2943490 RepID=A0ABT1G1S7_9CORY|nr:UvrD-helicase domain-containing protein [Corynebacterium stercoris]MCP1387945.1 DEAD/DEAH box helicase [Corynebacterium stercoris]
MGPKALSSALGQKFPPTDQQAAVIGAEPGPLLVVAGAGAGKTETMAARVVWLVANGYARPEEILGLTFTRKAAQELGKRIRDRLEQLAADDALVRRLDPSGELADALTVIAPTVSTYDSYSGDLIREYGLLVPVEPDARLITDAELHAIATDVVSDYTGTLIADGGKNPALNTVVGNLLGLVTSMGNELALPERIAEQADIFLKETESLPKGPRSRGEYPQDLANWRAKQAERIAYLPLVKELQDELRRRGVVTFNEQMSVAAGLARDHAVVGEQQRRRFRVVMLDEYQDTSHAQRVLLRSLFGEGKDPDLTVTAVGDPMQAIYGWRGATAANLAAFVTDFPVAGGEEAPKKQLTTSWRNPPEVLQLANGVSDAILGTGADRAVAALVSRPDAGAGDVTLGYFDTNDEEVAFVADELAAQFQDAQRRQAPFTAAVLVRKNRHSAEVAEALEERGVPYEIVGVGGLLDVPEVADTVAIATMLVRPGDSAAALRVLGGPAVGLGLKDLSALAARAVNLRGHGERDTEPSEASDPAEALQIALDEMVARAHNLTEHTEPVAGLADAVADLGEPERYSPEGLRRLKDLAAKLRWLRTHSLGKKLTDLFADIIAVFGIRTEVLARPSAARAVHLDKLLDAVAAYPGASLDGLLDYFELAREREDGLAPGAVAVKHDRVQILTAHKAKGLEWDTVAVLHADASTYGAKAETFLTFLNLLQDETFGDPDVYPDFAEVETRSDFLKAGNAWRGIMREAQAEESARLFYVAVTRAERKLLVTAARTNATSSSETAPYEHFEAMLARADESCVVTWSAGDDEVSSEASASTRTGTWPHLAPADAELAAAAAVDAARAELPAFSGGELYALWERDVSALIEEHEAAQNPDVPVVVPGELTASDVVAMRADPAQFARRARRPVPFKPNAYAKRGTAFHEWLEGFYGARPLLDENELPGHDEAEVDRAILEQLKANFEASHWASRTPAFVERPFELALGESVVRGRIDAIFEDTDGWTVVDWKTGQRPNRAEMESAKLQLAVYREAWRRIAGDGRDVRAVFFYVRTGEDYAPTDVPEGAELERLVALETLGARVDEWGTVSPVDAGPAPDGASEGSGA